MLIQFAAIDPGRILQVARYGRKVAAQDPDRERQGEAVYVMIRDSTLSSSPNVLITRNSGRMMAMRGPCARRDKNVTSVEAPRKECAPEGTAEFHDELSTATLAATSRLFRKKDGMLSIAPSRAYQ